MFMDKRKTQSAFTPIELPAARRRGFTLIELLVVLGMLSIILTLTLPSVMAIFNAGQDAQAYNLLSAQLMVARALAIQQSTFAGVHVQLADPNAQPELEDVCFSAVVFLRDVDPGANVNMKWQLADGYRPIRLPGDMAFGKLTDAFVTDEEYDLDPNLDAFICFTIVFSPNGAAVRYNVDFDPNDPLFRVDDDSYTQLWDHELANDENGQVSVTAVTMFNYFELRNRSSIGGDRVDYLNQNGQFLPVNVYTGMLLPRR